MKKATQWEKDILDVTSKPMSFSVTTEETQTSTCLAILRPCSLVLLSSFNFLQRGFVLCHWVDGFECHVSLSVRFI